MCMSVCACVRVSVPKAMNNYSHELKFNNWLNKFYCFSVSLYDTCHCGLSNKAHRELLPKKSKVMLY